MCWWGCKSPSASQTQHGPGLSLLQHSFSSSTTHRGHSKYLLRNTQTPLSNPPAFMPQIHVPERCQPCQRLPCTLTFTSGEQSTAVPRPRCQEHGAACPPHPGPPGLGGPKGSDREPESRGLQVTPRPARGDPSEAQNRRSGRAGTEQRCVVGRRSGAG